jgi:S1-C subfamily serine protease
MLAAQLPIEEGRGVLVASVDEKALAAERDLKRLRVHDVITHLNEDTVDSPEEFHRALQQIPPGAHIDMRILRKGITRILRTERAHR